MTDERRLLVEKAMLAEQSDRWEDVVVLMKTVVQLGRELTVDERNLLATAYKNYVGAKRAAWRIVSGIEQQTEGNLRKRELAGEYRRNIEMELKQCCNELLELIEKYLINTTDMENKIFYLKMKGDYYRYMAELCKETTADGDIFKNAENAYEEALELAKEQLNPSHPVRLGLILNFSVFCYEILNAYEKACDVAKVGISLAKDDGHHAHMTESAGNDSDMIVQLLGDNLAIWSVEMEGLSRGTL